MVCFIHLNAPWLPLHVYVPFLPFLSSPFHSDPKATVWMIKLYLSLRFASFYPDASPNLFFKELQHLLLKVTFTVKEAFASERAFFFFFFAPLFLKKHFFLF